MVYAAQPREGTETALWASAFSCALAQVYAAQPREGTETKCYLDTNKLNIILGLCSSTPRGDGNAYMSHILFGQRTYLVYAAQPREGTETSYG